MFPSRSPAFPMVAPMRSKPLLSKFALLKRRKAAQSLLPVRIADLDGCELTAHCDGCGRHLRLYPGIADHHPNTHLVRLLEQVTCSARRGGKACGGRPRRLFLLREERQWMLDASGTWQEDESLYWEADDFEFIAEPRQRQAA
jgi:hypothetical protein